MKKIYLLLAISSIAFSSCKSGKHADLGDGIFADITTTKGEILLKLEYEKTPLTVANFISLAEGSNPFVTDSLKGKKYYNGIIFHRIIKDFMIQGGDPTGTGMGNPGYKFKDEFNDSLTHHKAGILSMTRTLAFEEAPHKVRVNAVCPGLTLTPFHVRRAAEAGRTEQDLRTEKVDHNLQRRWADAREVAYPILWLASDEASFVTASTVMVDGGTRV